MLENNLPNTMLLSDQAFCQASALLLGSFYFPFYILPLFDQQSSYSD